jgi:hypothetical protein
MSQRRVSQKVNVSEHMFCNVLGLFFNKGSYSGEPVHEFHFTLYIAYEEAAYGGQDSTRVVMSKIKDDDDDIACTGECLLPFVPESSAFLFVF